MTTRPSRTTQLGEQFYPMPISRLLAHYYRSRDHRGKLRLLSWLERILGTKRILVGTRWGFQIAVDHADLIQRTVLFKSEWEPEVSLFLVDLLTKEDVFYDIGANVGYFSCLAASKGIRRLVAFEPDPLNCQILRLNLGLNRCFTTDWSIEQMGVGDRDSRIAFGRAHVANTGVSGFCKFDGVETFEVPVTSLDSIVARGRLPAPTVMKIDVEGWETLVVRGAAQVLRSAPPRSIVFEADVGVDGQLSSAELATTLGACGYRIERIPRDSGVFEAKENFVAHLE